MKILKKPFGNYQTNCYVLLFNGFELVIDPGYGAKDWVVEHCKNPIAILLTHGHHDHIWNVALLKEYYKDIQIYCPVQDSFMVETDCFNLNLRTCDIDVKVENTKDVKTFSINGVEISYWHFPGHTPGCSMIDIENNFFSGDFIFKRSIGRSDLPFSSNDDMKESLIRFSNVKKSKDMPMYPGHGDNTSLFAERRITPDWIGLFD